MRLDEWQRFIDAEFVDAQTVTPGSDARTPAPAPAGTVAGSRPDPAVVAAPAEPVIEWEPDEAPAGPAEPAADEPAGQAAPADEALSAEPSEEPVRARRSDYDSGAITDIHIAPFAEYIGVRGPEEQRSSLDLHFHDDAEGAADPGIRADEAAMPAPLRAAADYPLAATATTLEALGLAEGDAADPVYAADILRKSEMLARLCDPVLSWEEAAALLGISAQQVRRLTETGELPSYVVPDTATRTELQLEQQSGTTYFQLSDIVALLAANRTPRRG